MAVISPITYGMPSGLVSVLLPAMAVFSQNVWSDDLNPNVATTDAMQISGATFDSVGPMGYAISSEMAYQVGNVSVMDAQLSTTTTANEDANRMIYATDCDSFGLLELGGEFEGVLTRASVETEEPWSIPRYKQQGTTLDCDTSTLLAASSVFIHNQTSGIIIAQSVSDGVGAFSIPMFEPGPHLVRAVNGARTAISLPVVAENV